MSVAVSSAPAWGYAAGSSYTYQPANTQQKPAGSPVVLEYGIYRDGDNNLDSAEAPVIPQAIAVSKANPSIQMTIEDTTSLAGGNLKTYNFLLNSGVISQLSATQRRDMSARSELANFVATTLDNAQQSGAKQTWIELVNHGAGDAGGLFTIKSDGSVAHMTEDDLAAAIKDGQELHWKRSVLRGQPDYRRVDGIMMHECFELTVGMAKALSDVGVRYLAASPETTIAPGIPTTVAANIANNVDDPYAMANAIVSNVISAKYRQHGLTYGPTAAFDVLDISPEKMDNVAAAEKNFNITVLELLPSTPNLKNRLIEDARQVPGMQRDEPTASVPWRADRPALSLYMGWAADPQLPMQVRQVALVAAWSIAATIMAHAETHGAVGFGNEYRDAIGPTTRFPIKRSQIDPLSPEISETACAYAWNSLRNSLIQALFLQSSAPSTAIQGNTATAA